LANQKNISNEMNIEHNMIWIINIVLIAFLIFLSSFFAAAEMSFVSVNRIKTRRKAKSGDKNAMILEKLLNKPGEVVSSIVICNNLVNITASILAGVTVAYSFGNIGVGIVTAIMTLLVVVFGEAIPKAYGIHNEKFAFKVARYLNFLTIIFSPITRGLSALSNVFLHILGKEVGKKAVFTEEEIKIMLDLGVQDGTIEKDEKHLVYEIFDFDETETKEVLIPFKSVYFLNQNDTLKDLKKRAVKTGHSRFPIYDDNKDNIIGIVHVKDALLKDDSILVKEIMKSVLFVQEKTKADNVLRKMQRKKAHMAVVKSNNGKILGIVTLEDLIEEIFGDISDEHDFT
jgi:CBS domain containing-hemolysin-like protein